MYFEKRTYINFSLVEYAHKKSKRIHLKRFQQKLIHFLSYLKVMLWKNYAFSISVSVAVFMKSKETGAGQILCGSVFIRVKTHLRLNSVPEKAHLEIHVNSVMIFCQNLTPPPSKHPGVSQNTVLLFLIFYRFLK